MRASASASTMPGVVRLALCQIPVVPSKSENLNTARSYISRASAAGATIAVLPECFNCPYDTSVFAAYAEPIPEPLGEIEAKASESLAMLRSAAIEEGIVVIGGSIPETDRATGKIYNTSVTFAPSGALVAKHRKVHLFDVDCSGTGGIVFKESDSLSAGNQVTVFDAADLKIGVAICYDIRFPDMSAAMTRAGADLLVFPGAFNMTTGPAHWELLARARAVDSQSFVAVCSPARVEGAKGYTPWGHSTVVNPWGEIVETADAGEALVIADVDTARLAQVRAAIPTRVQRRPEVYAS